MQNYNFLDKHKSELYLYYESKQSQKNSKYLCVTNNFVDSNAYFQSNVALYRFVSTYFQAKILESEIKYS